MPEESGSKREEVYDSEISPLMEKIIGICAQHDISLNATFFLDGDLICKTHIQRPYHAHMFELWLLGCAQACRDNVDRLIMSIMKKARITGHSSICLQQLGVPLEPSEKNKDNANA